MAREWELTLLFKCAELLAEKDEATTVVGRIFCRKILRVLVKSRARSLSAKVFDNSVRNKVARFMVFADCCTRRRGPVIVADLRRGFIVDQSEYSVGKLAL